MLPLQIQISIFGAEILVGLITRNSRDSAVGIMTGLRTAKPTNHGSISGEGQRLPLLQNVQTLSGAQSRLSHIGI
jgi:hypothetical protein